MSSELVVQLVNENVCCVMLEPRLMVFVDYALLGKKQKQIDNRYKNKVGFVFVLLS